MNLFDEAENKYYDLTTYLLKEKNEILYKDIFNMVDALIPGEMDFEVIEAMFPNEEGSELVFFNDNGKLAPVIDTKFPLRLTTIEKQAAKTLVDNQYVDSFLKKETIDKLKRVTKSIEVDWNPKDITIKNTFVNKSIKQSKDYYEDLYVISSAIRDKQMICYDNVREGRVNIIKGKAFPIKIEYSVSNDKFRICVYLPEEKRFIKMNLDSMDNVSLEDKHFDGDLLELYHKFIRNNTETVKLEVDPLDHAIERCFRIFSYYDRKAIYDKQENFYHLEISYFSADKNEIIKNILSIGSYAVVVEPKNIRNEVYKRIIKARNNYSF